MLASPLFIRIPDSTMTEATRAESRFRLMPGKAAPLMVPLFGMQRAGRP
jgi:hypothetical protein